MASSSSQDLKKYDVFISFRGSDTRSGFTSHLHAALTRSYIQTYIDYRIEKGNQVWAQIAEAIKDSTLFLVVFSQNYASSTWCLNELVEIMECHRNRQDVVVIPVFYQIEPSHVRKQTGSYATALAKHKKQGNHDDHKMQNWKNALIEAANLPGFDSTTYGTESDLIEDITRVVLGKLNHNYTNELTSNFILDENYWRIQSLIKQIDSTEVQIIGLWGMGGIGKTTLAAAMFHKISFQYEGSCFLDNVTEVSKMHGINYTCNKLLSKLLREDVDIVTSKVIPSIFIRRLKCMKSFIVLDDVHTSELLQNLIGVGHGWLGPGSTVIVTTRDERVLISGGIEKIHQVKKMNSRNSLQLFSLNAFDRVLPKEGYVELSERAIDYAEGNPLALKVLGSFLRCKSEMEWNCALAKLKEIPNAKIDRILRWGYNELDDKEKDIFLDIACFFKGYKRDRVTKILNGCGFFAEIGISCLLDKALIRVDFENCLQMHDLIQEMGIQIVLEECPKNPGQRCRLCDPEEVCDILKNNRGTEIVEDIILDANEYTNINLSPKAFQKMINLRLLPVRDHKGIKSIIMSHSLDFLLETLKKISWNEDPLKSLPPTFFPEMLVELSLQGSRVENLWNGEMNLPNLERFSLTGSTKLIECPNVSASPKVDSSSFSRKLKKLSLYECESVKRLSSNTCMDADEKGSLVNDVDVNRRMVEQIPYAVAESLFNRLTSTTFREYGRIYGVIDELERLKNTVESIRVVLLDAQKKQEQECVVQNWIKRLKDVLHLADDLLDEFIIEGMIYKVDADDKNQVTWVHSSDSSHNFLHQKMALEIEKIQQKFDDVLEEMAKLKLSPKAVVVKQTDSLRRKSISFLLESDITGREDDKKEIINLLRQPHGNISSIAIVGIGGIGKTTLAQVVYNDVEVQNHFEKQMWVCVSNNFDVKTIVKKMLESLINSKIDDKLSFEYIQHKLRENLTGERYLLVLDDICNASHKWTQLRTYLMCGAEDSKVLMTTRSKIVSDRLEASNICVLNGLTLEASWSVLKKITFGDETNEVDQNLETTGKKIAEKCMGVPLAIRTIGGILQSKTEKCEWLDVLKGEFWEICEDNENIMSILKLSYQSLSLQLRQCFAYCSLYPKGWEIEKDLLIQLWMAHGYLECSDEKQLMEDAGNEFVKIFLMKSFFQDAKLGEDGDIVSFKMHDLMRDLAMQVAGNDCCYLASEAKKCVPRPIHVSLEPNAFHLLNSLDASRLRTLILLSTNEEEELNDDKLSVFLNFKHLRVLKLSYCSLSKLSSSIGKLKHLRYLNLSHSRGLGSLYKSIGSLVFLQTLILTPNEKMEFSTMVVSKLINLRHLHISDWEAFGFVKLSNWKYEGMVFSNWLSPLTNIVEISFFLCGSFRYLPPLERLPFLKSLHISFLEELEYIYYEQDFTSFFPSLKSLSLQFCYKLKGWRRMGDDFNNTNCSQNLSLPPFPCLSQLSIIRCRMLTCMPAFPKLENRLELYNSNVETLVPTLNTIALKNLNDFCPLSILKSLHIDGVSLDVKRIPKDWMQNLTSLQLLQINWFSCKVFQEIEIWFKHDHKCLPSLQTIAFHNCEDLEALPDWICNLSSLQHLTVCDCINLASLPEGMPRLTNLQTLEIIGCPLLDEECQTQSGETWPKICHVPKIILSSLH